MLRYCLAAGVLLAACANDSSQTTATQLQGLSVVNESGNQVIFLGRRADLASELADSLAGKQTDELWYRVELPANAMPAPSETKDFELGSTPQMTIAIRRPWIANPESVAAGLSDDNYFATAQFPADSPKVSGVLQILGSDAAAERSSSPEASGKAGLRFLLTYEGEIELEAAFGKHTLKYVKTTMNVGGLFDPPPIEG